MRLAILDADTYGPVEIGCWEDGFDRVDRYGVTAPDEVADRIREAGIVIVNKVRVGAEALAEAVELRLICLAATGTDNVDLTAAAARGTVVCNVPAYATDTAANHTFALYFHLAHHTADHDAYAKSGAWSRDTRFTYLQKPIGQLSGKTWGIVGLGAIGRAVAVAARGFGCAVVYHGTSGANLDQPYPRLALDELLTRADVVSIHCPLNRHTHHLIGAAQLGLMKKTALLINTARGGVVDEAALAHALDAGRLAGAGIDVLPQEPPPADHPLLGLRHPERLALTPHVSGSSLAARRKLVTEVRANIDAFLAGEARNRVGP